MPDRIVMWASRGRAHIGPKQLFVIAAAYLSASGVEPGQEWRQPTEYPQAWKRVDP